MFLFVSYNFCLKYFVQKLITTEYGLISCFDLEVKSRNYLALEHGTNGIF